MSRIEIIDVTDDNVVLLQEINTKLFPLLRYNYLFYASILDNNEALAKIIYYNGNMAGAVTAHPDISVKKSRGFYILTLGVLSQYRRLGLGKMLMKSVINYANDSGKFERIILHVQVSNVTAIQFYKYFNFEICETRENYYKTLKPSAAYLLQKNLKKTTRKSKRVQIIGTKPINGLKKTRIRKAGE